MNSFVSKAKCEGFNLETTVAMFVLMGCGCGFGIYFEFNKGLRVDKCFD